jgi:hypothetical protein
MENIKIVVSRRTTTGLQIEIGVGTGHGAVWVFGRLVPGPTDGRAGLGRINPPLAKAGHVFTHSAGNIAITAEEAAEVEAAMEAARADLRASPEGLRAQREDLAERAEAVLAEIERARERAFERDIGKIPSYDSPKYRAAMTALQKFDKEHPEVIAKMTADRKEAAKRAMCH